MATCHIQANPAGLCGCAAASGSRSEIARREGHVGVSGQGCFSGAVSAWNQFIFICVEDVAMKLVSMI